MQNFKITVSKPCSENWESMKPLEKGRFCDSCEKEVIDFTKFTNQELASWFKQDKGMSCGRLNPAQLNHLIVPKSNFSLKIFKPSLIAASMIAFLSFPKLSVAHTKLYYPTFLFEDKTKSPVTITIQKTDSNIVIKGRVIDNEDKQPVVGLFIAIKGGKVIGTTDVKGNFEIKLDRAKFSKKTILEFRYLGYETKEFKLNLNKHNPIFIEMKVSALILGGIAIIREKSLFEKIQEFFNV
ncbi:hypothetical protein GM921_02075 [Pedobacter sp. LMG 31464]|uniref:CarboxypepD_reg-like domain-containing protein n=1 Tax=Pedobacter planticolens TaxID=2679964 RepID=A0A923DUS5_9SPHI|nr:carboxypeptidase-like regulatory domain-containing protein [Pedobacter planticolens]MBB2144261.1 hypothetical protein [Pedobacter planticolens]